MNRETNFATGTKMEAGQSRDACGFEPWLHAKEAPRRPRQSTGLANPVEVDFLLILV